MNYITTSRPLKQIIGPTMIRGQPVWDSLFNLLARLAGFEPATHGLEVRCSVQLSYRRNGMMGGR